VYPAPAEAAPTQDDEAIKKILQLVKDRWDLSENVHKLYRPRWDEWGGLYSNYRTLAKAIGDAENDRDDVIRGAKREWGADLHIPRVFATIETIVPRVLSNDPTMKVRPKTPAAKESAQAVQELMNAKQLEIDYDLKLEPTVRRGLMFGLGVQKTFWREQTKTVIRTLPSASGKGYQLVPQEVSLYSGPDVEDVDLYDFRWDPVARSIETSRYLIHRTWRDFDYVEKKVESEEWLPIDLEKVKNFDKSAAYAENWQGRLDSAGMESKLDLGKGGLHEVWEYHDREKVYTILDGTYVVVADDSPYYHREFPFQIFRPIVQPGEFVGKGIIEPIAPLANELDTLRGQRLDAATLVLQRPFTYREDRVDPSTLKIGPGVGIPVMGDPSTDIVPLMFPDLPASSYQETQEIKEDFETATGVSDSTAGGSAGGTAGTDTATGIQLIQQALNVRIKHYTKKLEREALRQGARQWLELFRQHWLEDHDVRIEDPLMAEGFRFIQVGPDQLLDDIEYPQPDAGSTEPEDTVTKQQTAQGIYQDLSQNPEADPRAVLLYYLKEMDVPNPESLLMQQDPKIDPRILAQALQEQFGTGPYSSDQILQATQAALQAQQEADQTVASGGQTTPPPSGG
jgi:hypothetical protein